MNITKKIIGISSNSKGIVIDKPVLDFMNLKKGDMISIKIKKMIK